MEDRISELETVQETLTADRNDLEVKRKEENERVVELEHTLRDLSDKFANTQADLAESQGEKDTYNNQLQSLQSTKESLESEKASLTAQLESAQNRLTFSDNERLVQLEEEIHILNSHLLSAKQDVLTAERENEQILIEMRTKEKELETTSNDKEKLDEDLINKSEELEGHKLQLNDLERLRSQADDFEGRLKMKDEKMSSLVESMQEMEERLQQLTAEAEQSGANTSSLTVADKVNITCIQILTIFF